MTDNELKQYLDQAVQLEVQKLTQRIDKLAINPAPASQTAKHYNPLTKVVQALKEEINQLKADKHALSEPVSGKQLSKISHSSKLAYLQAKASYQEAIKQARLEYEAIQEKELQAIGERNAKQLELTEYKHAITHGSYAEATAAIRKRKAMIDQQGSVCELGISGYKFKGILSDNILESFEPIIGDEVCINGHDYAIVKADLSPIGGSNFYKVRFIK